MLIQITDAGIALMEGATAPLVMTSFKLGAAYGYTPDPDQTDLQGPIVYTGVPSAPQPATTNAILYASLVPESVGPFEFGEIGLYYNSTLFAICVLDEPLQKDPLDPNVNTGGAIVLDFFVPVTSTNYQMWASVAQANTLKASTVLGPEGLPPSPNATPNVFVVEPAGIGQTFLAFSDRFGVWSFTGFGEVGNATVVSATNNSITVANEDVASLVYQGLGSIMAQFTTGAAYSATRYIDGITPSGVNTVLSFNAPLAILPNPGDALKLYEPASIQTPSGTVPPGIFTTLVSTGATTLGPMTAVRINSTPIGNLSPSTGRFTALTVLGASLLNEVSATSLDVPIIGGTLPGEATFTQLSVLGDLNVGGSVTLTSIDGTPIGITTPAAAKFTTLTSTGTTTLGAVTATSLNATPIGAITPAAGRFTTLTTTSVATVNGLVSTGNAQLQGVTATSITATGAVTVGSLTVNGAATFTTIDGTPIGQATPAAGRFTTLTSTGNTNLGNTTTGTLQATAINATPIGGTNAAAGRFTTLTATDATSLQAVTATTFTASAIDATPIGATTASTGRFTTLVATSVASLGAGVNFTGANSPLLLNNQVGNAGQVLASAGPGATPVWTNAVVSGGNPSFASLTVTGNSTLGAVTASAINSTPIGTVTPQTGQFTTVTATVGVVTPSLTMSGPITLGASTGNAGQVLISGGAGAAPAWAAAVMVGSSPTFPAVTISNTATIATAEVTTANLATANITKLNLTANQALSVNGLVGTTGQVLTSQGPGAAPQWVNIAVSNANLTSGTINGVVIGGTTPAAGSFTSLNLVGATSPMLLSGAAGTAGQVLTSQGPGATPIWTTPAAIGSVVTITGGTANSLVIGNLLPAQGTFSEIAVIATSTLADVTATSVATDQLIITEDRPFYVNGYAGTAGQVLTSTGTTTAPVWQTPTVPSAAAITSGTIVNVTIDESPIGLQTPAAAAFTSVKLTGSTSPLLLNTSAGTAGQVLTSQGPGATPIWTTPTTEGSVNITGGNINGTIIGNTVRAAGSFTTLSANGGLTLTGTAPLTIGASPGTAGQALASAGAGAAPVWINVVVPNANATLAVVTATAGVTLSGGTAPVTLNGAAGTAGQVLTSAGPGATPTWTTPSAGGAAPAVVTQTGTTYTSALTDVPAASGYQGIVTMNNAAANTVTINNLAYTVGSTLQIVQLGTGTTSVVAGSGVTLNTASSLSCRVRYSAIVLTYLGSGVWIVNGDTA